MKLRFPNTQLAVLLVAAMLPWCAANAGPDDWESPEAIVHALYEVISAEAGAERDWNRFRDLFLDDARLAVSFDSEVMSGIMSSSVEELIEQTETAYAATGFHEIPLVTRVDQFGLMASVLSSFEVKLRRDDEKPMMRGLNHFQLLNDGERWWIVSNIGVMETASWTLPEGF